MSTPPLLLGLDAGTSRVKALLFDEAGEQVAFSSAATPFVRGRYGTEMTVEAFHAAVGAALAGLGRERRRVVGVGVAGLAESGAPLDRSGRPLAPIIAWHDPRGAETAELLERHFGEELSHRIGQRLRPVSSVAKLGWLLEHGVDGVSRWLGVPELCLFQLTGVQVTEHSLAARTGCYDVTRGAWLPEVAERAGFAIDVFPPVEMAGADMARVSTPGVQWSGLPEGVPVTLAGHDHLAGADGCGGAEEDLFNSVGTAETVIGRQREVPDVARSLAARVAITVRPGGEGWATLAGAARSGMVLDQVAELLGYSPGQLDAMVGGGAPVDVGEWLEATARGELPARQGPERPVGAGGTDAPPGAVWSGVLQALSLRTRDAVRRTTELMGLAPGGQARLVVFGGGSRSRPWLSAKAATLSMPIWRSTVEEAAARGAALRAGVAAGWWRSPADAPAAALQQEGGPDCPP